MREARRCGLGRYLHAEGAAGVAEAARCFKMIAASACCERARGQKEALLANSSDGNRRTSVNDDFDVRHLSSASLVWCLRSKHQIIETAARATDAKMVSALLCHTNGLGSSL